jgi:translation initiation factor eIF-2B subunit beta
VRKVLHHIREEYNTAAQQAGKVNESFSLSTFVIMGHPRVQARGLALTPSSMSRSSSSAELDRQSNIAEGFRPVLLDAIQDVIDELETVYDNVSKNAKEHIHSELVPLSFVIFYLTVHTVKSY